MYMYTYIFICIYIYIREQHTAAAAAVCCSMDTYTYIYIYTYIYYIIAETLFISCENVTLFKKVCFENMNFCSKIQSFQRKLFICFENMICSFKNMIRSQNINYWLRKFDFVGMNVV